MARIVSIGNQDFEGIIKKIQQGIISRQSEENELLYEWYRIENFPFFWFG